MKLTIRIPVWLLAALMATLSLSPAPAQAPITSPEKFFGFQLGADRKIARWDRIVEYYRLMERESGGRLKAVTMGPSTMGNPFLLVIVSSAKNMAALERLRQVNASLSDPRGLSEDQVKNLISEGKAVVCQSMSLHASEIGGTQMAPELAYDLLARRDQETQRILDNVITLLVPSFNPDGAIMVADWYQKTLGTRYEGSDLPWLYHKYAGHDNNRDAFQTNLVESQYMAKILFRDWVPQAYVDHHHMGSYGARIYLPPYAEPVRPWGDPLIWREMSWYGAHMAYKEEEAGLSGVLNMAQYSGWGHFGFHWITPFHNIAGMLTESASAKLATPIYIHPDQLKGDTRGLPQYEQQTTFPDPWPGGWWRLRDVVERQKVSAWALLDLMARNRETVLWNAYQKARRQTVRGGEGRPAAYAIPATQHDRLAAVTLVNKLLAQGIQIQQAAAGFSTSGGMAYPPGSWMVPLGQPKMGLIRYLLGRTLYPDNEWTRYRDGSPMRPYDMATDTMAEFMGVRVDPVDETPRGDLRRVATAIEPVGRVAQNSAGYTWDGRLNRSFRVMNMLLEKGVAVRRIGEAGHGLRPGDFITTGADLELLSTMAKQTGVDFAALPAGISSQSSHPLKRLRTGMYARYYGGNIDEGWTRWLLEHYGFPYTSLKDAEIQKGGLNGKYDVIILPHDSTRMITGEREKTALETRRIEEEVAPEYRSGIGEEGVKSLRTFVEKGGTLVTLGAAGNFAIEKLGLSLRDVTAHKNSKEFWCPGSTLKVKFENSHPLAYGMPAEGLGLYLAGSPVFEVLPSEHNERYEVVARFADSDLLQSGWLIGEQTLAKKAAVVQAKYGDGRVILFGIRPQHRAQTYGTFKLLFNALVGE